MAARRSSGVLMRQWRAICSAVRGLLVGVWSMTLGAPAHPLSAGRGSKLIRVSCVKAFCMAVGYRTVNHVRAPLSELWNGKTWKILPQVR
jgi:hypothetical protein